MGRGKLIAEVGKSTITQHTSVRATNYIPKKGRAAHEHRTQKKGG